MTAATLFTPGQSKLAVSTHPIPPATAPSVGVALQELVTAARHLALALWAAATQAPVVEARALTTAEQAAQVRAMADIQMRFDMRFAQELYAIANRHETAARSS
jgi:hypothetical protein